MNHLASVMLQSSSLNLSGTVPDGGASHTPSDQQRTSSARFPQPDYEQLRMLATMYEAQVPVRHPLSRIAFMIGIFVIGALLGLAGVRWMVVPSGGEVVAPFERSVSLPTWTLQKRNKFQTFNAAKGISPGELPYDGAPVEQAVGAPPINQDELPYGGLHAGSMAVDQDTPPVALSRNEDVVAKPAEKKAVARASVGEEKGAKARQKRRVVQHIAKDKEIERIRQQAAEELKKKTESKRALAAYANSRRSTSQPSSPQSSSQEPPAAPSASSKTPAMLARCEHAANFFLREQCKWRLCSGKWGKNGCPSYATHGGFY